MPAYDGEADVAHPAVVYLVVGVVRLRVESVRDISAHVVLAAAEEVRVEREDDRPRTFEVREVRCLVAARLPEGVHAVGADEPHADVGDGNSTPRVQADRDLEGLPFANCRP